MNEWTLPDFLTYVYQLVADSDFQTEEKEIALVKERVKEVLQKHFGISSYSYEESLKRIQGDERVSLLNCTDVVKERMPLFEFSREAKKDIFSDLEKIASSDNRVTESENKTIAFIKQVFSTVEMPLSW